MVKISLTKRRSTDEVMSNQPESVVTITSQSDQFRSTHPSQSPQLNVRSISVNVCLGHERGPLTFRMLREEVEAPGGEQGGGLGPGH